MMVWSAVVIWMAGCATTGKMVASTSSTVEHAMQMWAVFVVDGHATPTQEARVKRALEDYYAAEDLVISAMKKGDPLTLETAKQWLKENRDLLLGLINGFQKGAQ